MLAKILNTEIDKWEKALPKRCLIDRDSSILSLCKGKTVLHLGAADAPFHKDKAKSGELLHMKLRGVCRSILGIDSNKAAVEYLRKNHGISDIKIGDASNIKGIAKSHKWDIVLCCDIIEHVDNFSGLLSFCANFMSRDSILVMTTINASSLRVAGRALLSREAVHPDHIAYFSYGTLARLLIQNSFTPTDVGFFRYKSESKVLNFIFNCICTLAPGSADGIMMLAKKK